MSGNDKAVVRPTRLAAHTDSTSSATRGFAVQGHRNARDCRRLVRAGVGQPRRYRPPSLRSGRCPRIDRAVRALEGGRGHGLNWSYRSSALQFISLNFG